MPGTDKPYKFDFGTFEVKPFLVAKHLITYGQFQAFVDAEDGFTDPRWWNKMPDEYLRQELYNQRAKVKNAPRDSISWYQSVAFARWMNHRLHGLAIPMAQVGTPFLASETMDGQNADGKNAVPTGSAWIIGSNSEIRLPTEWEWQWMAQDGVKVNTYPWGEWQMGYANTSEAGLNRTTAVGVYPHGAADCGALDVAGNLWEWCLNDRNNPETVDGYSNGQSKVLRGGSFLDDLSNAAASARNDHGPYFRNLYYGFRLVVVRLSPASDL